MKVKDWIKKKNLEKQKREKIAERKYDADLTKKAKQAEATIVRMKEREKKLEVINKLKSYDTRKPSKIINFSKKAITGIQKYNDWRDNRPKSKSKKRNDDLFGGMF